MDKNISYCQEWNPEVQNRIPNTRVCLLASILMSQSHDALNAENNTVMSTQM